MDKKIPPLASKQLEPLLTPISDIKPHPDNYKIHTPEQIKDLRASLKAFGCTQPIKANLEGVIVAGHGMYQLYMEDGYTDVPVMFEALDKKLSKAYLVADNETARKAQTNQDQLGKLLEEIGEIPNFDIEATGFDLNEFDSLIEASFVGSEEEAEKEAEQAVKEYINLEKDSINIFHALTGELLGCINRFNYLFSYTQGEKSIIKPFPKDSILFLDSGALAGVLKFGPEFVSLETQEKIVQYAEEMHEFELLSAYICPECKKVIDAYYIGNLPIKTKSDSYSFHPYLPMNASYNRYDPHYKFGHKYGGGYLIMCNHNDTLCNLKINVEQKTDNTILIEDVCNKRPPILAINKKEGN